MEETTGARIGDLEDLNIISTLSRRSSVSLRPVGRRAMRSSQKMPIRITIIGETSIVDFSV